MAGWTCEKDLIVDYKLNTIQQHDVAAKTANMNDAQLHQQQCSVQITVAFNSALVRPHLEFCVQLWAWQFKKDIENVKQVHRRLSRMIKGLETELCEECLRELDMFTLAKWRLRCDTTAIFNYLKDCCGEDGMNLFSAAPEGRTKSAGIKFQVRRYWLNNGKNVLTGRVVWERTFCYLFIERREDEGCVCVARACTHFNGESSPQGSHFGWQFHDSKAGFPGGLVLLFDKLNSAQCAFILAYSACKCESWNTSFTEATYL